MNKMFFYKNYDDETAKTENLNASNIGVLRGTADPLHLQPNSPGHLQACVKIN